MTELISVLMPHLSESRRLGYLLCWQGFIEADRGDFEKAYASVMEAYSMGRHIRGQNTTLIEQLVAMGLETSSTYNIRILLREYSPQMDADTLNRIRQQYHALIDNEDFKAGFQSERLLLYDEIQRCFTDSRFGQSHLYLPRIQMLDSPDILGYEIPAITAAAFHILFTHPDKKETLQAAEAFYDEMEIIQAQTPAALHAQAIDIESHFEKLSDGNFLLQVLTPALGKVLQLSYRNQLDSQATLVVLALFEYQKVHGHLPNTLDKLVQTQLLQTIPTDPFSDEPLHYRKTDEDFVLYSVGSNFTDDGGTPGSNDKGKPQQWGSHGDWVFWPVTDN